MWFGLWNVEFVEYLQFFGFIWSIIIIIVREFAFKSCFTIVTAVAIRMITVCIASIRWNFNRLLIIHFEIFTHKFYVEQILVFTFFWLNKNCLVYCYEVMIITNRRTMFLRSNMFYYSLNRTYPHRIYSVNVLIVSLSVKRERMCVFVLFFLKEVHL